MKSSEKHTESIQGVNWYSAERFDPLSKLAEKFGVYVFKSDLKGALQTPTTKKESKPLKALEVILRKIEDGTIPREFYGMASFLSKHIEKFK